MNVVEDLFIDHTPLRAPREGTPGECIYLQLWQEFAAANAKEFEHVFWDMPDAIDQRVATVAASFMVFMGCNGGADFTYQAKRLCANFSYSRDAFLAAFALQNQRRTGVDGGLRLVEYMLAPAYPFEDRGRGVHRLNWANVPAITQKDMDAIECMAVWWSTPQADRMRAIAEPLIEAAKRKAYSGMFGHPLQAYNAVAAL